MIGSPLGQPGSLPDFVLVTSNRHKALEAERIIGATIECLAVDLPEIQSSDLLEVLAAKAEEAWRRLRRPLVVEETGLELAALNGFPGPLVRWLLEAVGPEGIAQLAHDRGDPRATARCAVCFRDARGSVVGVGHTEGELVLPARGAAGFGWDPVFLPRELAQTYGELSDSAKDEIGHRGRAWRDLARKLAG